jgi:AcrR family transcriptional regulator
MFQTYVYMSLTSTHTTAPLVDNRSKILETAEDLFGRHGFSATSLRAITAEAGVNLASVNYYFGSKDHLIVEVLSRAIRPLNERRLSLLAAARQTHPTRPIPLPLILDCMLRPCLEMAFDPSRERTFQLLGRSLSEEGNFIEQIIEREWTPVVGKFMQALKETLPSVPETEIYWRIHFTVGAMIHTSCHHRDLTLLSGGLCRLDLKPTLARLIHYASAGLENAAKPPHP